MKNSWFAKQRYLIDFTFRSLARRKAKNLGLLMVYGLIVFMLASVMTFSSALKREAVTTLSGAPEVIVQRMTAGRHDLIHQDYLSKIQGIRGVTKAQGRRWGYFFDPILQANYTFWVQPDKNLKPGEVILGNGISRTRGAYPGDIISLRSYQNQPFAFHIKKVLSSNSEIATTDLVLLNDQDFIDFFNFPADAYTDLALSVRNPNEIVKVAQKVQVLLPDVRLIIKPEILRTYESVFNWREGIVLINLVGALLAFGIFAWDKASGLSAEEKREIGILKAVGWNTSDIINMKFWEGALISITAFGAGLILAHLHVFYSSASLFEPVLKGWAVLYPKFNLAPYVDWMQVSTLFFFTVLPYCLATVVPVWKAAVTDPSQTMR